MIVGLYLRHIKTYKNIHFVPIGDYKFINYLGKNGSGKSSIIEGFDSFFNGREYSINKSAKKAGLNKTSNVPYFVPIFLIEKSKITTNNKKDFETLSNFFWNVEEKTITASVRKSGPEVSEFFKLRNSIIEKKSTHFLIMIGETVFKNVYIPFFQEQINPLKNIADEDNLDDSQNTFDIKFKSVLETIKKTYSYVYIPVEIDVEDFTKIETASMQKVFGKTLKDEIMQVLSQTDINKINTKLNDFIKELEIKLNGEYYYESISLSKKNLTPYDLFEKILEVYFKRRVLNKGNSSDKKLAKKVSELSAGEKRQALIDLLYAFLTDGNERDRYVVIGIDEPENSLHNGLCYEQFEKLKEISKKYQVLITTHWYGFLPTISEGVGHFLNKTKEDKVKFETYELYSYRSTIKQDIENNGNRIPQDFQLKSMNDLVQSIFHSIGQENSYNWLICEGMSEKIYFDYYFKNEIQNKNLKILALGGYKEVIRLYRYLELPMKETKNLSEFKGKIYCLIDTDNQITGDDIKDGLNSLKIRRLSNKHYIDETDLVTLDNKEIFKTEIENALNPKIFKKVLHSMTNDKKYRIDDDIKVEQLKNTDFSASLENYKINHFFDENTGKNKVEFAEKYIAELKSLSNAQQYIPNWIKKIKEFYN